MMSNTPSTPSIPSTSGTSGTSGTSCVSRITSNTSMRECVFRMHNVGDGAVALWNGSHEFKVVMRNDPTDSDTTVAFEFGIMGDEEDDDDVITRVLQLEMDGYWDEGMFVVDTCVVEHAKLVEDPGVLDDARCRLNEVLQWTVCGCGQHFVKDGAALCLMCQLMAPEGGAPMHACGICFEDGPESHMHRQACCGQILHTMCLARCHASATARAGSCPFCRQAALNPVKVHCL